MFYLKILVTYYTGTGNTEKVAKAIKDALEEHEVDLFPVKEVDPNTLSSYDLAFLGSGTYGFNVSRKITSLVKKATQLPSKFAYFYTHESSTPWPKAFNSVNNIILKQNCDVLGEFDCCGENLVPKAQEQREAMYSRLSLEERKEAEETYLKYVKGHPNEEDLENAKKFTQSVIDKL